MVHNASWSSCWCTMVITAAGNVYRDHFIDLNNNNQSDDESWRSNKKDDWPYPVLPNFILAWRPSFYYSSPQEGHAINRSILTSCLNNDCETLGKIDPAGTSNWSSKGKVVPRNVGSWLLHGPERLVCSPPHAGEIEERGVRGSSREPGRGEFLFECRLIISTYKIHLAGVYSKLR